jgi:hypothetical protein
MLTGVAASTLAKLALAAGAVALFSLGRALLRWRASSAAPPRGLLTACLALVLEHAQSAGVLLAAACALPLPILPLAWAAARLAPRSGGVFLFLPLAFLCSLAALAISAAAAACVCWFVLQRLAGRPADLPGLARAARLHFSGVRRWAKAFLEKPEEVPFNPFVLPALLAAEADLPTAARRAAAFAAEAPLAAGAVMPLHRLLTAALVSVLAVFLPLTIGFFCLPLVSYMGYSLDLSWGIDPYIALWAAFGSALCAVMTLVTLLAAAALAHASAVYAYGCGGEDARRRALRKLKTEWLWPSQPPVTAAPVAAEPAAAEPPPPAPPPPAPPPPPEPRRASPQPAYRPDPDFPEIAPGPPAAGSTVPFPEAEEYAQERILPVAGRMELGIGAAARPSEGEVVVFYPDALAPDPKRRLIGRAALAAYRAAVLLSAFILAFYLLAAYDGLDIARRHFALIKGAEGEGVVEAVEAAPKGGMLQYRMTYSFQGGGASGWAQSYVGEPARVLARRGARVPVRVLTDGPLVRVVLVEDYGFSRQRTALLLALVAFLLVGAWSFVFRVL